MAPRPRRAIAGRGRRREPRVTSELDPAPSLETTVAPAGSSSVFASCSLVSPHAGPCGAKSAGGDKSSLGAESPGVAGRDTAGMVAAIAGSSAVPSARSPAPKSRSQAARSKPQTAQNAASGHRWDPQDGQNAARSVMIQAHPMPHVGRRRLVVWLRDAWPSSPPPLSVVGRVARYRANPHNQRPRG